MPISLKAAQGGSKAIFKERPLWKSGTFVAPVSAVYLVTAIGPGGSGAWAPTGAGTAATGGAAGGMAQKKVRLNAGDQLTIVIGAGGTPPATAGTNGNDGGNTTVSGPGLALIARGGKGGKTKPLGTGTADGAVGGLAEGGDVNLQGGGSGSATTTATTTGVEALTGGGAVAIKGVGHPSGAATSGFSTALTGGAGVGGPSGDAVSTTQKAITLPGSAVRGSASKTNVSVSASDVTEADYPHAADGTAGVAYQSRMLWPNSSVTPSNGVYAAGSGSAAIETGTTSTTRAGLFAGSGARQGASALRKTVPGVGGGSGATTESSAAPGGDGFVMIEWFEDLE